MRPTPMLQCGKVLETFLWADDMHHNTANPELCRFLNLDLSTSAVLVSVEERHLHVSFPGGDKNSIVHLYYTCKRKAKMMYW